MYNSKYKNLSILYTFFSDSSKQKKKWPYTFICVYNANKLLLENNLIIYFFFTFSFLILKIIFFIIIIISCVQNIFFYYFKFYIFCDTFIKFSFYNKVELKRKKKKTRQNENKKIKFFINSYNFFVFFALKYYSWCLFI